MCSFKPCVAEPVKKSPVMIPRIHSPEHRPAWQTLLQASVKSSDELLRLLEIDPATLNIRPLASNFPLRVPPGFVDRMVRGDSNDPLLRQVLPVLEESREAAGYGCDPLDEHIYGSTRISRKSSSAVVTR
jgi:L-lysine 2,3-aminomutase